MRLERYCFISRRWPEAVLITIRGVPYLAPELQLLFKSEDARPKDDVDAASVIPELEPEGRAWLAHRLPADHGWHTLIER